MALRYAEEIDSKYRQIGFAFVMGCTIVGSIIFNNYLLGVIVILGVIMLKHLKKEDTQYIPIEINKRGISVDNEFLEYEKFTAFYIDTSNEENDYLLLKSKGAIFRNVSIIIIEPEVDIDELRTFLSQHLTEKEIKQNATDKLMNSF